ncbi:MAG: DNA-directed RNA polymerase subunit alpha [Dehalococcoidales bacterium]|nr:DNA-directed RNA polymerase subunit alpha [Dehalococcoidales bacterium]
MSQLVIPHVECVESRDGFGRFLAEPLVKDFGLTLGNALRRVMLGYIPGAAVTRVKIEGIQHEFSSIPYVKEDVIEFFLNVKALRLKPISGQSGKLTLEVEGKGQVYAADIKPSADFEITNPDLYLATLDSPEARLYAEFDIEIGEGYKEAEAGDNLPIGTIPIDAIFTPVRKVNFTVEPVHIGLETNRERLSLEVWTDGTIEPVDAISKGADILIKQLSPFANYVEVAPVNEEEHTIQQPVLDEKYSILVEQLDLSVRTMNCLRRGGITTVGELLSKSEQELLSLRNFGRKSMKELEDRMNLLGLSLTLQNKDKLADLDTDYLDDSESVE